MSAERYGWLRSLRDPSIDKVVLDGRDMTIIALARLDNLGSTVAKLGLVFDHLVVMSVEQAQGMEADQP